MKEYLVFTTYPDRPVKGNSSSNNPHYIGMVTSDEELKKLAGLLHPDLVLFDSYPSKQSANEFIQDRLDETPFYKVYERMTVMSDEYLSLHGLPLGTVTIESKEIA